jgi:parallel beta-helix repeat protein
VFVAKRAHFGKEQKMKRLCLMICVVGLIFSGVSTAEDAIYDDFEDGVIDTTLWVIGGSRGGVGGPGSGGGQWFNQEVIAEDGYLQARATTPTSGGTNGAQAWTTTVYNFNDGRNWIINFKWEADVQTVGQGTQDYHLIEITDGQTTWWPSGMYYPPQDVVLPGTEQLYLENGVEVSPQRWSIYINHTTSTATLYEGANRTGTVHSVKTLDSAIPWYLRFITVVVTAAGYPAKDCRINLYSFSAAPEPPSSLVPGFTVETYANLPGHPAMLSFDYTTGALYVGYDPGNGRIWRVEPGGAAVVPYGQTDISDPDAVLFDASGLISDTPGAVLVGTSNHPSYTQGSVLAILPDESVVTIFDFTSDFINPGDMAFDSTGRLLFTDISGEKVMQTTSSSNTPAVLFTVSRNPVGIAIDSQGRIYTGNSDGTICRHDADGALLDCPWVTGMQTGIPGVVEGVPLAFGPVCGVWGTDLYSIDRDQNFVRIHVDDGSIDIIGSGFPVVADLAFGPDGALYASIYEENRILRIVPEPVRTYHVDGSGGDNTNDGLTRETAFKTIQRGINAAEDYDTVLVWPGVYNEEIGFWGDAITVKSAADAAVVETDYGYAFSFLSAEGPDTVLSNFVIRNSQYGIYLVNGSSPTLRNLTIVNNDFGISAFNGSDPDISNCILWGNYYGDLFRDPVPLQAKYSFVQEKIEANLVSYWKLDGDGNDSAGDNDGTIYGAIPTTGQIGGALSFDGDDYVQVADDDSLDISNNITISAWINPSNISSIRMIVSKYKDYAGMSYLLELRDEKLHFMLRDVGSLFGTQVFSTGIWYLVAATYDGSQMITYINGELDNEQAASGTIPITTQELNIGRQADNNLWPFEGLIDEVRIYDRGLSAEEIEAMYEAGLGGLSYGEPGFVDANSDDYHLLSERGRYWPAHDVWVLDEVTSPCIDGGDPTVDPSNEPMPNGGRINMGAYGNSAYASMSEWPIAGDANRDGRFDFVDFAIFADQWLARLPWTQ